MPDRTTAPLEDPMTRPRYGTCEHQTHAADLYGPPEWCEADTHPAAAYCPAHGGPDPDDPNPNPAQLED